jgi:predicted TIM-barrel fold metal-dependent hydrolase
MITDCHIHISPLEMFKPPALELMKQKRPNFEEIREFCRSPKAFLNYLDACGVDRAVLINYVAPEVIGFTSGVNEFIADYVKENPRRLLSCGSLHPRHTTNVLADMEQILRLGIRMIKIHPPHQLLYPNDYLNGVKELEIIYRAAEANGVPVMFHTGTSIFPGARNKYGDPMYVDDVAVDFPKLKILCGCRRRFFSSGDMPMSISISAEFRRERCFSIFPAWKKSRTKLSSAPIGRGRAFRM